MKIKKINEMINNDENLTKFGNWLVEDILEIDILGPYIDYNYIEYDDDVEYNFYLKNPSFEIMSFIYDKLEESIYIDNIGNVSAGKHDDHGDDNQIYFTLHFNMSDIEEHIESEKRHG